MTAFTFTPCTSRWYDVRLSACNDSVRVHFVARWDEMPLRDVIDLLESFTGSGGEKNIVLGPR